MYYSMTQTNYLPEHIGDAESRHKAVFLEHIVEGLYQYIDDLIDRQKNRLREEFDVQIAADKTSVRIQNLLDILKRQEESLLQGKWFGKRKLKREMEYVQSEILALLGKRPNTLYGGYLHLHELFITYTINKRHRFLDSHNLIVPTRCEIRARLILKKDYADCSFDELVYLVTDRDMPNDEKGNSISDFPPEPDR